MPRSPRTPKGDPGADRRPRPEGDGGGEADDGGRPRTYPGGGGEDRTQVIRQQGSASPQGNHQRDDRRDGPPREIVGYGRSRDDASATPRYLRGGDQDRDDWDRTDWDQHGAPAASTGQGWQEDRWDEQRGGPQQPDREPAPGGGGHPPGGQPPRTGRKKRRPRYGLRRVLVVLLVLILAYVGSMIWAVTSVWNSVNRVDATPTSSNRPADGSGTNFVMVGTDSRDDLDRDRRNELVTGHEMGSARADTIMVLHLPESGGPVLISIPRDSFVEIPGHGQNKVNAAYNLGGPALLVDTLEQSTGMRMDGYLEIGFGGFVDVVDIVGGVEMCLDEPVQDDITRLDLPAGCQELIGADALNYVRMRYSDPMGDLGRVERQREFLAALISDIATPGTVLVPWRLNDVGTSTASVLTIGEDTSMWEAGRMAWAMRQLAGGGGHSFTVPIADPNYPTGVGSTVLWDEAAAATLFDDLNAGRSLTVDP